MSEVDMLAVSVFVVVGVSVFIGIITHGFQEAERRGKRQGWADGILKMRDEAVAIGHAEYYLDEKHERQWRWLPAAEERT